MCAMHGRHFCRRPAGYKNRVMYTYICDYNANISIKHKFQLEHKTPNTFFILHLFDPGDQQVSL